jgi:integrase/recombinase XerC
MDRLISDFRQHLMEVKLSSQKTIESYVIDTRLFITWVEKNIGPFQPNRIIPYDIKRFIEHDDKLPSTKNRRRASIFSLFEYFRNTGEVQVNPCHSVKAYKISKINLDKQWLDKREQHQILYEVEKENNEKLRIRDIAIIRILLNCGLRLEELQQLKISDVDLTAGTITIRSGKGNKYRVQTIATEKKLTMNAIKNWLKVRINDDSEFLFTSSRGTHIAKRTIQTLVQKYGERAGLGSVSPHQLRHSCGKNLVDAGYPIEFVAEMLGHESIETTRRYITPAKNEVIVAASMIEQ